jgi:DNA invertase Pin-like site-specific DNA recombinase
VRAAVYLRVSTDRQDEANQEPDCLRICEARKWEPVIVRETESGAKHRPQWERVKQMVHRGEVGAVVIWALDRAGRDRVRLAHDLAELARKGSDLASVREPWLDQPSGPMRDLLIQVMAWFAQMERDRLRERTRAGLARAVAQGKKLGRPATVTPTQLRDAKEAVLRGAPVATAAREAGVGRRTLRNYLAQKGPQKAEGKTA